MKIKKRIPNIIDRYADSIQANFARALSSFVVFCIAQKILGCSAPVVLWQLIVAFTVVLIGIPFIEDVLWYIFLRN